MTYQGEAIQAFYSSSNGGHTEASEDGWTGETGLITDVVDRLEEDVSEVEAYVCGPPPMVEAAIALLERRGVPESQIHFDKFTTTEQ